jgi:hypothetical protein
MSSNEDFSVTIAASGRYDHQDHSANGGGGSPSSSSTAPASTPHIIHAVNVTQPVQSWTVLRDHVDFMTMDVALSSAISGLPSCPNHPAFTTPTTADPSHYHHHSASSSDTDKIIQARNSAQEWLSAVLTVPAVRESPVMRQFLCYGANIVPPQFEDVAWINFSSNATTAASSVGGATNNMAVASAASLVSSSTEGVNTTGSVAQAPSSPTYASIVASNTTPIVANKSNNNFDEMEMDDMFALDDDDDDDHHHDDGVDDDDDDDASYLQGRFNPTEETISQSEIMEIQQDYKEVEMVEDVGSLAQSLGASHLGRSLNLQKEMMSYKASQVKMGEAVTQMNVVGNNNTGIHIMGNNNTPPTHPYGGSGGGVTTSSSSPGGIGGAMAKAQQQQGNNQQMMLNSQAHVEGLGDSFHRTVPVSAPRLDSFRMIKVIGKGSFGK